MSPLAVMVRPLPSKKYPVGAFSCQVSGYEKEPLGIVFDLGFWGLTCNDIGSRQIYAKRFYPAANHF